MMEVPVGVFAAILVWVFCLGWIVCNLHHRVGMDDGAETPDPAANPLGEGGWQPRSSSLEMTPAREARLRALNPHFAKAHDQLKASDAHAQQILETLTGSKAQAAQPETPAKGNVRALPNPQRRV
jgi:hypothetical protein